MKSQRTFSVLTSVSDEGKQGDVGDHRLVPKQGCVLAVKTSDLPLVKRTRFPGAASVEVAA